VTYSYTAKAVEAAFAEHFEDADESWYEAENWVRDRQEYYPVRQVVDGRLQLTIDGTVTLVEYKDGKMPAEGGGEEIWVVVKIGNQYFRKDGYYMSHDSAYWDGDLHEVAPEVRSVTFYESV
jgi:hypothetical protein